MTYTWTDMFRGRGSFHSKRGRSSHRSVKNWKSSWKRWN